MNKSDRPVWITIQDWGRTRNMDWGRVEPHASRSWQSGNYTAGNYIVRFEFFDDHNRKICDTHMLSWQTFPLGGRAFVYGFYDPKTKGCWLSHYENGKQH